MMVVAGIHSLFLSLTLHIVTMTTYLPFMSVRSSQAARYCPFLFFNHVFRTNLHANDLVLSVSTFSSFVFLLPPISLSLRLSRLMTKSFGSCFTNAAFTEPKWLNIIYISIFFNTFEVSSSKETGIAGLIGL